MTKVVCIAHVLLRRCVSILFCIVIALLTVSGELHAASEVAVDVDFNTSAAQPNWYRHEQNHIRIQKNGGSADAALLEAIGTKNERSFVRLDKWKPTKSSALKTEHGRYGLGDSWLEDMNNRAVAPWITQEVDAWKDAHDWWIEPPLSRQDLDLYEALLYDIVLYIKNKSPQTQIVEMMNEPNLGRFKLSTQDQVNLYLSNARVVNRLNRDLGLPKPNSPKLISGGPSSIKTAFVPSGGNYQFKEWVDGVFAATDFEEIRPAFFSFHRFGSSQQPALFYDIAQTIRAYLDDPKFEGAWENTPIWVTAYNLRGEADFTADPTAAQTAQAAASFAASHHFFMQGNIASSAVFAQSNYRDYINSVLMPEAQAGSNPLSYYMPGQKTAVYNYFDMVSRIEGSRVTVLQEGAPAMNGDGVGYGTEAIKGVGKGWILSWNYGYPGNPPDVSSTYTLTGLESFGISATQEAEAKIYLIDKRHSNIAAGNIARDGLELVDTVRLAPTSNERSIRLETEGQSVVLIEVSPVGATLTPTITPQVTTVTTPTPSILISPACELTQAGDANCDGVVSMIDYVVWRSEFIASCVPLEPDKCGLDENGDGNMMDGDFNQDGKISLSDYSIWMYEYLSR